MRKKPVVAITMGDPAGIGPEISLKAAQVPRVRKSVTPVIVGDMGVLRMHAKRMGIPGQLRPVNMKADVLFDDPEIVPVLNLENVMPRDRVFGRARVSLSRASAFYVVTAARLALEGKVAAMTTGPIRKEGLRHGGHEFPGHTEMVAHICKAKNPVMLLVHGKMRIAHISTHCALRDAIRRVRRKRVTYVGRVFHQALRHFVRGAPRLAVAGLNPHASENGLFGDEERREISPAVEDLRREGIEVEGPEPPDTVFAKLRGGYYDGVVAMYHDQGHIAGKTLTFRFDSKGRAGVRGVNVTLGLPIVRTSVEHGTGFDIAGKGIADACSMVDALLLAARMSRDDRRRKQT